MKDLSSVSHREWLTLLEQLADIADPIALHFFKKASLKVEEKDNMTPVSEGDLAIEKEVRRILSETYPDLAVLGEEFGSCPQESPFKLIIDPIDGTSNFIRGIPIFAALLGLEVNGTIVAGVVSAPATKDRWSAARGLGATHNGTPIKVTSVSSLTESQAFYGGLFGKEARGNRDQLLTLLSQTKRQRGIGDYYAHTLVAMGCGEFAIDFGLAPWDLAPLGILVEEAGGKATQVNGDPFSPYTQSILVSNGLVHDEVVRVYKG